MVNSENFISAKNGLESESNHVDTLIKRTSDLSEVYSNHNPIQDFIKTPTNEFIYQQLLNETLTLDKQMKVTDKKENIIKNFKDSRPIPVRGQLLMSVVDQTNERVIHE